MFMNIWTKATVCCGHNVGTDSTNDILDSKYHVASVCETRYVGVSLSAVRKRVWVCWRQNNVNVSSMLYPIGIVTKRPTPLLSANEDVLMMYSGGYLLSGSQYLVYVAYKYEAGQGNNIVFNSHPVSSSRSSSRVQQKHSFSIYFDARVPDTKVRSHPVRIFD